MPLRLPLSREKMDTLSSWLEEMTGLSSRYFQTKITNKFPGMTDEEAMGVSGIHLYIEAIDVRHETIWYGNIIDLHAGQIVWVTHLPPKEFDGSRYFQYAGVISGCPF